MNEWMNLWKSLTLEANLMCYYMRCYYFVILIHHGKKRSFHLEESFILLSLHSLLSLLTQLQGEIKSQSKSCIAFLSTAWHLTSHVPGLLSCHKYSFLKGTMKWNSVSRLQWQKSVGFLFLYCVGTFKTHKLREYSSWAILYFIPLNTFTAESTDHTPA